MTVVSAFDGEFNVTDNFVCMFFGYNQFEGSLYDQLWVYNRSNSWWTELSYNFNEAPAARVGHSLLTIDEPKSQVSTPKERKGRVTFESLFGSVLSMSPPPSTSQLVVMYGGFNGVSYMRDSLWLWNPNSLEWSLLFQNDLSNSVAPPPTAFQSAVFYNNSLVVFGGECSCGSNIYNFVWSYNFDSLNWTFLAVGPDGGGPRSRHSAVVWNDSMYVFGGCTWFCIPTNELWWFDFPTGTWNNVSDVNSTAWPVARSEHVGVLLDSGLMAVYGGIGADGSILNDAWLFNFTDQTWRQVFPEGVPALGWAEQGAVVVDGKSVIMFGGTSSNQAVSPQTVAFFQWNVESDGTAGDWNNLTTPMLAPVYTPLAAISSNSEVIYFVDRVSGLFARYLVGEQYWETLPSALSSKRSIESMGLVYLNSSFLVTLQQNLMDLSYTLLGFYNVDFNSWNVAKLEVAVSQFSSVNLVPETSTALVLGGQTLISIDLNSVNYTTMYAPPLPCPYGHSAVLLNDTLFVFGVDQTVYLTYQVSTDYWSNQTWPAHSVLPLSPPFARQYTTVVAMGVKVLLIGGVDSVGNIFSDLWELNSISMNWTKVETPAGGPRPRMWATGASRNTTLYLFGGSTGFEYLQDFWQISLGCNPGSACINAYYYSASCEICANGSYSSSPGSTSCNPCPFGLTTTTVGATSSEDCTQCEPDYCHHGNCNATLRGAVCICEPGYLNLDNCRFPWIWCVATIGAVLTVGLGIGGIRRYQKKLALKQNTIDQQLEEISELTNVWKIDPLEVTWISKINSGGFGEVWRCEWRENIVATKKLHQHWVIDIEV